MKGKAKLNSATYVDTIFDLILFLFWQRMCEERGWAVIVEDNASGHKKHANIYRELMLELDPFRVRGVQIGGTTDRSEERWTE